VGAADGVWLTGDADGRSEGRMVGERDGRAEGLVVGLAVGLAVGLGVGEGVTAPRYVARSWYVLPRRQIVCTSHCDVIFSACTPRP
jgi:hypothetical protein